MRLTKILLLACLPAALMPIRPSAGQEAGENSVHWAYSTYFGTGWYQINGDRNAFALRYEPKRLLREPVLDRRGEREIGIRLRVPITVGLDHFPLDDIRGSVNPDNLANLSITPGIYVTVPMNRRWTLRPFVAAGWGTVLNGSESAWTYWAGIRSRLVTFRDERRELALVNSAGFVGYSPDNGPSSGFWPLMNAVEFTHPLADCDCGKDRWRLTWHGAYTYFQSDLDAIKPDLSTQPISDQWELGLAFSRDGGKVGFWRLQFDRFGFAYRFSSDGDLKGIGLVFSSLFDQ